MGMDVYGNKPKNECGKYFGMNAWGWRSLATYAREIAPEITAKCKYWYTNDFDGLNGDDSMLLADLLQKEIDSGRTEWYARLQHRPAVANYEFSAENVHEFVYFLRYCGGFEIC